MTINTTAADLSGDESPSPGGILQWAIRFCQTPESFPVFMEWIRSIWPDFPYTEAEVAEDLRRAHNLVGLALRGRS